MRFLRENSCISRTIIIFKVSRSKPILTTYRVRKKGDPYISERREQKRDERREKRAVRREKNEERRAHSAQRREKNEAKREKREARREKRRISPKMSNK